MGVVRRAVRIALQEAGRRATEYPEHGFFVVEECCDNPDFMCYLYYYENERMLSCIVDGICLFLLGGMLSCLS